MIYLDKPTIKSLLQVFDSLMAKDGCLFVDATEAPLFATLFVVLIWPIKGCFDGIVNNKKRMWPQHR
jgi:hypothetical protein